MTTQPQTNKREFNVDGTHTVGQFLNAHLDAKRVVAANRREANESFYKLETRAHLKGAAL